MPYNLAYEETHTAPKYALKSYINKKGEVATCSSKEPTGATVETTFKVWRCSHCRAWFVGSSPPAVCGKCKNP